MTSTHDRSGFDASFERILAAYENPENHALCAHIWEFSEHPMPKKRDYQGSYQNLYARRGEEIRMLTGVMKGDADEIYDDMHGFKTRHQKAEPEGMIGLATTALIKYRPTPLFWHSASCGVLLLDPPMVYVSAEDADSRYRDNRATTGKGTIAAFDRKLVLASVSETELGRELMRKQELVPGEDPRKIEDRLIVLDPHCPAQAEKARAAYDALVGAYRDEAQGYVRLSNKERTKWNEVNVNAKAEHMAAIIVMDKGSDADAPDWRTRLQDNPQLARSLYEGLASWHGVKWELGDHPLPQELTIVVYNPSAQASSVLTHFAPTPEHIAMLEEVLIEQQLCELPAQLGKALEDYVFIENQLKQAADNPTPNRVIDLTEASRERMKLLPASQKTGAR